MPVLHFPRRSIIAISACSASDIGTAAGSGFFKLSCLPIGPSPAQVPASGVVGRQ